MFNFFSSTVKKEKSSSEVLEEYATWEQIAKPLNDFEKGLLEKIEQEGIAVAHISDFGEDAEALFYEIQRHAMTNVAKQKSHIREVEAELNQDEAPSQTEKEGFVVPHTLKKDFLFRLEGSILGGELTTQESPFRNLALYEPILNIIGHYFNNVPHLGFHHLAYIIPVPENRPPTASQCWHRDPFPSPVMNLFVYLNDVLSEETGPFIYARNSHSKGKWHSRFPIDEKKIYYSPCGKVEKTIPAEDIFTCLGISGTVILADPSGVHRGGYCQRGRSRLAATVWFIDPSVKTLPWRGVKRETLERLTPLGRMALGNYELAKPS